MDLQNETATRSKLSAYTRPNDVLAFSILGADLFIYCAAVFFAVTSEMLAIKILSASLAGFMIAQLFVIGHDAAHKAFVSNPGANVFIARLVFLPALHNYTLWLFAHNRLHHAYPNVKDYNSWAPMSADEYQALPGWKKLVHRLYRSQLGFGPYYIFERWLKDKFVPRSHIPKASHRGGWRDFALLVVYGTSFVGLLIGVANYSNQSVFSTLLFGAVIPFIVWSHAIGLTIYQHHTHPKVKWYKALAPWRSEVNSTGEVSVHIKYPTWYNIITHNIYIHPAHHVNAKVPLYNLRKAEQELVSSYPDMVQLTPFSFKDFLHTVKSCKLYDYEQQQWLNYQGVPTTPSLLSRGTPQQQVAS